MAPSNNNVIWVASESSAYRTQYKFVEPATNPRLR